MARLYSNENFPLQAVDQLRKLEHDVLTSLQAGNANLGVPDEDVLKFAAAQQRILITFNRIDFLRLHRQSGIQHAGIIVCTFDPNFAALARRIDVKLCSEANMVGKLIRVNRPQ